MIELSKKYILQYNDNSCKLQVNTFISNLLDPVINEYVYFLNSCINLNSSIYYNSEILNNISNIANTSTTLPVEFGPEYLYTYNGEINYYRIKRVDKKLLDILFEIWDDIHNYGLSINHDLLFDLKTNYIKYTKYSNILSIL